MSMFGISQRYSCSPQSAIRVERFPLRPSAALPEGEAALFEVPVQLRLALLDQGLALIVGKVQVRFSQPVVGSDPLHDGVVG